MLRNILLSFIPLFVAVDVVGLLPVFISLTQGMEQAEKRRVIYQSLAIIQEYGLWATLISVAANIVLCGALLGLSGVLLRFLGRSGSRALSKITSLLLGAIAVMLIRKGIVDLLGRL